MKTIIKMFAFLIASGFFAAGTPAFAEDGKGSVTIISPKEGAVLSSAEDIIIEYEMTPGPKGDHVHFYVDGGSAGLLRKNKGSFNVAKLKPGKHALTVKIVSAGHTPIGVETSVNVTVK